MAATVYIPAQLRADTGGEHTVRAHGSTIAEVIDDLDKRYPRIRDKLVDVDGVRRFVHIFIGEVDIRFEGGLYTPVHDGDEISIMAAIAGG